MTYREANALSHTVRLSCFNGSDWKDYLQLEPPNEAARCKVMWRFWGAPGDKTDNVSDLISLSHVHGLA